MARNFVEVVFESNQKYLEGFLQGYLLGKKADLRYYFSRAVGVKAESLSEKIREWATLSDKYHYLIMEKKLYEAIMQTGAVQDAGEALVKVVAVQRVKSGQFEVAINSASRDESKAVKEMLKLRPPVVEMIDWQQSVEIDKEARGVELYTPAHEYQFKASGSFKGAVDVLIAFRQKLTEFSSVTAKEIKLERV